MLFTLYLPVASAELQEFDTFPSSRFLVVCKFSPRLQHADRLSLTNQVKSSFCLSCILIILFTFFFKYIIICILVFI